MIFGFGATAIRLTGEKVLKSKGLAGLSLASLDYCGERFLSVRLSYVLLIYVGRLELTTLPSL